MTRHASVCGKRFSHRKWQSISTGILAAVLMSMVALIQSGEGSRASMMTQVGSHQATATQAVAAKPAVSVVSVKIVGAAKPGPDGKKHDMFTKTDFTVKAGQPVTLKIDNTDDAPHSITAPAAGVNIIAQPGVHTYTLLATKAGRYQWYCMLPCDGDANGWAMRHPGYMSGYITAT